MRQSTACTIVLFCGMIVPFQKMSGAGNTFIVADSRQLPPDADLGLLAPLICSEEQGHGGADGFMAIAPANNPSSPLDFTMLYFNRDGSTGMMCGNGGRCAVRFAADHGFVQNPDSITFSNAGVNYQARLTERGVLVRFPSPRLIRLRQSLTLFGARWPYHFVDVGTPHAILFLEDISDEEPTHLSELDVARWGEAVRHHEAFRPGGANANFVQATGDRSGILLRTFERGVEAETGACGTGAIASAIVAAGRYGLAESVAVTTTSGATLYVGFTVEEDSIQNVFLEGDATVMMTGELQLG